jgi:SAM-dependent methyltransferase
MDARTVQYYDDNAEAVFAQYSTSRSGLEKYFSLAFRPGSEILDVGAGSGRDLGILIREQYDAYGAEPSPRLRALAVARIPGLAGRIHEGALPNLAALIGRKFDGVLCAAVFQHIPVEERIDAARDLRDLLKPGGRLLIAVPRDRPGIDADMRDERGRLFNPTAEEELVRLFESLGFHCVGQWVDPDSLGRPGFTWTTLLFTSGFAE